ncbi:60S acidic ribosomal protein P0 [Porphyridium purpureum]|uniref:60S acidic ribosomal protein P0 n=1 Tax=Porphyridium purpureum TaxID=35688 RepID=A0A5J4YPD5_PORPP|nr:60S acidic ribosomal protein P0 [Porphyridium purpureum]|eukprot:POR8861..scf249_10
MVHATKKVKYFSRLEQLLGQYPKFLLVNADNVGSKQLQELRIQLRGSTEICMGKNTMMRKCIRGLVKKNPALEQLLPKLVGNVGFVFTTMDLKECRDILLSNKVPAGAKAGTLAQCDVTIPAGPTGMEPTLTSFFQILNIQTKINKGAIEIIADVHLLTKGEKIGSSEVALLQKLKLMPFSYALQVIDIYDNGSMYDPKVLDITEADIVAHMVTGLKNVAAISLAADYPTAASVPHSIASGFSNLMYVALGSDVTFPRVEKLKALLDDPEALAALAAAAPAAGSAAAAPAAAAAAAPEPEPEEEEEEADFDLFD